MRVNGLGVVGVWRNNRVKGLRFGRHWEASLAGWVGWSRWELRPHICSSLGGGNVGGQGTSCLLIRKINFAMFGPFHPYWDPF